MAIIRQNKREIKEIDNKETNLQLIEIEKERVRRIVIEHYEHNRWVDILDMIKDKTFKHVNDLILNGNSIFHLACIRGETEFIKDLFKLKKNGDIQLNTNILNADGLPGIHLYYSYGGSDKSLLDNDDDCYLDSQLRTLAIHLVDRIELFEVLIEKMKEKGCLENTEILNDGHLYIELIRKIIYYRKIDKDVSDRYLKSVRYIYSVLRSPWLVFIAINYNCIEVIKMLMEFNFDFLSYSSHRWSTTLSDYRIWMTTLAAAVKLKLTEIPFYILEYTQKQFGDFAAYRLINTPDREYSRPVFIAISDENYDIINMMIKYMAGYITALEKRGEVFYFKSEIDNGKNTYLHRLLTVNDVFKVPIKIMNFFIDHTDLNQENYAGVTPAHLLFGKGVWIHFKERLIGRQIDLLKIDDLGNNCYSYVPKDQIEEFLKLTTKIKVPLQLKIADEANLLFKGAVLDMLNIAPLDLAKDKDIDKLGYVDINNVRSKNYGLFNSNMYHYFLYLKYLLNKHKNVYVPVRPYDEKRRDRDIFFTDLTSYSLSPKQTILNKQVKSYMRLFYSYILHNVFWTDSEEYYIDKDLIDTLKIHDKSVSPENQRYVYIKITIIVNPSLLHANTLLYDRVKKQAWRFEPYGIAEVNDTKPMDNILQEMLEQVYGKITYMNPDDYLAGLNFQMVDGEDYVINKNLGDPGGYCLAWSLWFIDAVLSHPDVDVDVMLRDFFTKHEVSDILSADEGDEIQSENYYLDFIRMYAHRLDEEKNKILRSLGVKKYYIYNSVMRDDVLEKIRTLFVVQPEADANNPQMHVIQPLQLEPSSTDTDTLDSDTTMVYDV